MRNKLRFLFFTLNMILLSGCALIPEEAEYEVSPVVKNYESPSYEVSVASKRDISETISLKVKYVPVQTEELSFGESGVRYGNIYVSAGDLVEEGELLAELDSDSLTETLSDYEEESTSLERELREAGENHELNLRKLQAQASTMERTDYEDAVSDENMNYQLGVTTLRNRLTVLELRIGEVKANIEKRRIYAPFSGVVSYVFSPGTGDLSDTSKTVVRLADTSLSLFTGQTNQASYFTEGLEVTITSGKTDYSAVVKSAEELGITKKERSDGKESVYFALQEDGSGLEDQDTGKITLVIHSEEGALSIDSEAIRIIGGQESVIYLDEKGLLRYKAVETGISDGDYTEILSGLSEGEEVILE